MPLADAADEAAASLERLHRRLSDVAARRAALEAQLLDAIRRNQAPELIAALRRALSLNR